MRLRLLLSEAWRSIGANVSTTFAAIMTVLIGMFLLGLVVAFGSWTVSYSDHVKRGLVLQIDFKVDSDKGGAATQAQKNAVANKLRADERVKKFKYVSKEEALKIMLKEHPDLVNGVPYNPLPDVIVVTPRHGEDLQAVFKSLHPLPAGVQKIVNDSKTSKKILQFAHVVEYTFGIVTAILLASASLLIANTIRLSIFSRRREIEVMKLVGATNWFIRGPFMIEGLICGFGGAIFAVLLLVIAKIVALPTIFDTIKPPADVHALAFPLTALIVMGIGLALGAVGSGVTLRRFLKV